MHHLMAKFWWILILRGVLGILLGITAIVWIVQLGLPASDLFGMGLFLRPAVIAATLILVMGLYAFIDGLFAFTLGLQNYGEGRHWWSYSAEGLISITMGLFAWLAPQRGGMSLFYWIAGWAVFTGLLEIFQGFDLNEYRERRKPFLFGGLVSVVFGLLVMAFHFRGEVLVWIMGGYAFLFGLPLLALGIRLHRYIKLIPKGE